MTLVDHRTEGALPPPPPKPVRPPTPPAPKETKVEASLHAVELSTKDMLKELTAAGFTAE